MAGGGRINWKMPEMVRERWCCVLDGTQHKKNIAAGTGDDPIPAAAFIAFYQCRADRQLQRIVFQSGILFCFCQL